MKELIIKWLSLLPHNEYFLNAYIQSVIILIFFMILAKLLLIIFVKYFEKIAAKTKSTIDDLIIKHFFSRRNYLLKLFGEKQD